MYLRTTSRRNRDGSRVEYFSLAHNEWDRDKKRSRVQVIHNFGRADRLDRDVLVRLVYSIARVCGLEVTDPLAEEVSTEEQLPPASAIELIRTYTLGTAAAVEGLWERLGIGPTLREVERREGTSVPCERALLAMVCNRLSKPCSKLRLFEEWLETVYLPDCWPLRRRQFYEAMDLLWRHTAEIEETIFFEVANLFNLDVDVIFYDLTSASFEVERADGAQEDGTPGLRQLGRGSDGHFGIQVIIALAVTRDGLPVRSWVFPGNTAHKTTLERVRADLRSWKLGRCLFVADSGLYSEDNLELLRRGAGRYVLAVRAASVKEVDQHVLTRPGRFKTLADNLRVKEVSLGDGVRGRRYFVCYNPQEAARQRKHRQEVLEALTAELARHKTADATAKWAITLLAQRSTGRYLSVNKRGQVVIDRDKVRKARRHDGKWVLTTNDDTLTSEDAAKAYQAQMVIERCFRSLKSGQIEITPMYHYLPRRIEAHVKICVLGLLIQRVAERSCSRPWRHIRRALDGVQLTQFHSDSYQFFQRNLLSADARRIFKTLKIQSPKKIMGVQPLP